MKIYNLEKNNIIFKASVLILIISLLMWLSGFPFRTDFAHAASVTSFSDTLTDSDTSVVSDHTMLFTTPTGVAADAEVIVTLSFAGTPIPAALNFDDIDFSYEVTPDGVCDTGDTELTLAAAPTGATMGVVRTSATVLTFTNGSTVIAGGSEICIEVGLNAEEGGATAEQITNSTSTGSNTIVLTGDFGDTGTARVFMIDDIIVTATVDTNFTFTIAGVASGQTAANGEAGTTDITTTATTIPWATLAPSTAKVARHDLTVSTNAANGFIVKVFQDQNLTSGSNDIDIFDDGTDGAPATWSVPAATPGSEATYGHTGITSDDAVLSGGDDFGSALYDAVGLVAAPIEVMYHTAPVAATGNGAAEIGYKIEISALQESSLGTAYTNTLTYIATPTF